MIGQNWLIAVLIGLSLPLVSKNIEQENTFALNTLPVDADHLESVYYANDTFCIYTGEKYGYMDKDGKQITSYIYDYAQPFQENLACVMENGKYGIINKEGKEVIPFQYDKLTSFSEGLAYFELGDSYGFLNRFGKQEFLLNCDSISPFKEGRALFSIDGNYGFIDKRGQEVVPAIYDDASLYTNGLSIVRKGIHSGVIDLAGNEIISITNDLVSFSENCIIVTNNKQERFFNKSGKEISNPSTVLHYGGNSYKIIQSNETYGLSDLDGNLILPPVYDNLEHIANTDLFIVCQNDKFGIIDLQGTVQVPLNYDRISVPYYGNVQPITYVDIKINSKWGILRLSDFTVTVSPAYDWIESFIDGHAIVYRNERYGLIDEMGNLTIPLGEYNYIFRISDFTLCLELNNKTYLAKNNGEKRSETSYDYINQFSKAGVFQIFSNHNKEGLLDPYGNEILPPIYDSISDSFPSLSGSDTCFMGINYDSSPQYSIFSSKKIQETDLSELLLTNEITPKLTEYHNLPQEQLVTGKRIAKLYKIEGFSSPILYLYTAPLRLTSFAESDSAFYSMENDTLNTLVRANECGGSFRGDCIQIYLDQTTEKVVLGTRGFYGGFGGYAGDYTFLHFKNHKLSHTDTLDWIEQDSINYSFDTEYLLENATAFYNTDNVPFTKDTILDADYFGMYSMNGEQIKLEEFELLRDNFIALPTY